MAKNLKPVRTYGTEIAIVSGHAVGGTEAITRVEGTGVTIAWTSTGVYTITLNEKWAALVCVQVTLAATTQADIETYFVVPAGVLTSNQTLQIKVYSSSNTLADLAALQWLNFTLTLRGSGVTT